MRPMTGISQPKTSSSNIEAAPIAVTILILIGLGALLASLRLGSHLHLHLPGHQGLIRIAAMMLAARVCRLPWAATIMASGAGVVAAISPTHGFDPTGPLAYVLSALVIDFSNRLAPQRQTNLFFMAVVGAAANATKPLSLSIISAVGGLQFESLVHGLAYPLAMHLVFGLGAGVSAWMLSTGFEFARRR